jgi:RHH-type transcriptional regulator, rel operon repressor / antitoxin RelB
VVYLYYNDVVVYKEANMTTLISLRLPKNLLKPLDKLSANSERPRTYLIKKALENYLEEYEDYQIALTRLLDKDDKIISPAELRKKLGV